MTFQALLSRLKTNLLCFAVYIARRIKISNWTSARLASTVAQLRGTNSRRRVARITRDARSRPIPETLRRCPSDAANNGFLAAYSDRRAGVPVRYFEVRAKSVSDPICTFEQAAVNTWPQTMPALILKHALEEAPQPQFLLPSLAIPKKCMPDVQLGDRLIVGKSCCCCVSQPVCILPVSEPSKPSVSGGDNNLTYLNETGVPFLVYQRDEPGLPHYYEPLGREAGAYIQFIADYYDCLPQACIWLFIPCCTAVNVRLESMNRPCEQTTLFIHGHQHAWHQLDMLESVRVLHWERLPGFADLNRRMGLWEMWLGKESFRRVGIPICSGPDVYNGSFPPTQARLVTPL